MANLYYFHYQFQKRLTEFFTELHQITANDTGKADYSNPLWKIKVSSMKDDAFQNSLITPEEINYPEGYLFTPEICETLISERPKLIIYSEGGLYHFWVNTAAMCLEWVRKNPRGIIVLASPHNDYNEIKNINRGVSEGLNSHGKFIYLLKTYLLSMNADLFVFNFRHINVFPIKNFQIMKSHHNATNHSLLQNLSVFASNIASDKSLPWRKVYLSRSKTIQPPITETLGTDLGKIKQVNIFDDERCSNEQLLEKYLSDLGFEIICPEDFDSMEEQIKYFHTVKTLIAVTGSGLANMLWMKPNGKVIEISVPIIVRGEESLQYLYPELAYGANLQHSHLPNPSRSAEEVIQRIEFTDGFKDYICS